MVQDRWSNKKNNYNMCIWLVSAQWGLRLGSRLKSSTTRKALVGPDQFCYDKNRASRRPLRWNVISVNADVLWRPSQKKD